MAKCNKLIRPNCTNEAELIVGWTVSNGKDQSTGPICMECGGVWWNELLTEMKYMACHDTVRIESLTDS